MLMVMSFIFSTPLFAQEPPTRQLEQSESTEQPENANDSSNQQAIKIWGTKVQSSSVYLGESEMTMKQADHLSDLMCIKNR